jgi:hypothetical protein
MQPTTASISWNKRDLIALIVLRALGWSSPTVRVDSVLPDSFLVIPS